MTSPRPWSSAIALLLLLFVLAAFVWLTSAALPEVVASHFGSSGAANGFMPRDTYITVFLAFIVGMPLFLVFLPDAIVRYGDKNLNIPDREYWLAPERREPTTAFVRMYCRSLAAAVAIFMGYVHWLVVRANALQPAELSTMGIAAGLAVFFLFLATWLFLFFARFRRHV